MTPRRDHVIDLILRQRHFSTVGSDHDIANRVDALDVGKRSWPTVRDARKPNAGTGRTYWKFHDVRIEVSDSVNDLRTPTRRRIEKRDLIFIFQVKAVLGVIGVVRAKDGRRLLDASARDR